MPVETIPKQTIYPRALPAEDPLNQTFREPSGNGALFCGAPDVVARFEDLCFGPAGAPLFRESAFAPYRVPEMVGTYRFASMTPGPEVIVSAGLHGNEPYPVLAMAEIAGTLLSDPESLRKGSVVLTLGNLEALYHGMRSVLPASHYGIESHDLNRMFCEGVPQGRASVEAHRNRIVKLLTGEYPEAPVGERQRIYVDLHTYGYYAEPYVICPSSRCELARALGIRRTITATDELSDRAFRGTSALFAVRKGIHETMVIEAGAHQDRASAIAPIVALRNLFQALEMDGGFPSLEASLAGQGLLELCGAPPPDEAIFRIEEAVVKPESRVDFARPFGNFDWIEQGEPLIVRGQEVVTVAPRSGVVLLPIGPKYQEPGGDVLYIGQRIA